MLNVSDKLWLISRKHIIHNAFALICSYLVLACYLIICLVFYLAIWRLTYLKGIFVSHETHNNIANKTVILLKLFSEWWICCSTKKKTIQILLRPPFFNSLAIELSRHISFQICSTYVCMFWLKSCMFTTTGY